MKKRKAECETTSHFSYAFSIKCEVNVKQCVFFVFRRVVCYFLIINII